MARETAPKIDFRIVYAPGSLAHDASAAASVSEVRAAQPCAAQRRVATIAEAFAGNGSAATRTDGRRSGWGGYAGRGREAAASRDATGLRAAGISSAGKCGDGPRAGSGGMRGGQPCGPAVLRGAAGTRRGGTGRVGAGAAFDQCV